MVLNQSVTMKQYAMLLLHAGVKTPSEKEFAQTAGKGIVPIGSERKYCIQQRDYS